MSFFTKVAKLMLAVILMILMIVISPFVAVFGAVANGLQRAFYWCLDRDKNGEAKS